MNRAVVLRSKGLTEAELVASLLAYNTDRCDPPKDESEVRKIAEWAMAQVADSSHVSARVTSLSGVTPRTVEWLWARRLPRGKLVTLDGDPGLGKSTVLLDLAARITTGRPMPDGTPGPLGDVVLLSAEDDPADTIAPRLLAAGADLARVHMLHEVRQGEEPRPFGLPDDAAVLLDVIQQTRAVLVIFDPLVAYLGDAINAHRDQHIRRALMPLAKAAAATGASIAALRHLNKNSEGMNPLYRGGGSIGLIGAARSGLLVAPDPQRPDYRVLSTIKSNLAVPAGSLAFRLVEAENGASAVDWAGASSYSAADLLRPPPTHEERSAVAEAEAVLEEILADGAVPADEVRASTKDAGVSERTLKRAKASLGVTSRRREGRWEWALGKRASKGANDA